MEDVTLSDPRALRALAHPVRLAILEEVQVRGPVTATVCGEAVGVSGSAASYHLRALERWGLVADAGGGRGRERPWRAVASGFRFEPADLGLAAEASGSLLLGQLVERGDRATRRYLEREAALPREWRRASHVANKTLRLTPEEAVEVVEAIERVVEPYLRSSREQAPKDAANTTFLIRVFPRDPGR
jgi:DNA-binding transcriptional ArsR family regulator